MAGRWDDLNARVIDEFRSTGGTVGGPFSGMPMILVHHKGAKTGTERIAPLVYLPVGDSFAIFGSMGGAPTSPQWYYNLKVHPETVVEVGDRTYRVRARELEGDERAPVWERQKQALPNFAEYEAKAKSFRDIPVVLLEPVTG